MNDPQVGRISIIFGQECTRGSMVGGSVPLFNRDIVRRERVVEASAASNAHRCAF
jgi:hypothetical protein